MSFGFQSIEHFFASVGKDVVKFAKAVGPQVAKADATLEANKPLIEGLTSLVSPQAAAIEDAAFALLGKASAAASDVSNAANAGGLSLSLDAQTIADIKALYPAIEAFAASRGIVKPAK